MTQVTNIHDLVYIGRRNPLLTSVAGYEGHFGNPFIIGTDGNREEVLKLYRTYFYERLLGDKTFRDRVQALKGKTLVCYCKPKECHGDIIREYLDWWTK